MSVDTSCPAWCDNDHPTGGVHRHLVGGDTVGGKLVLVVIQQVPGGDAVVAISGDVYLAIGDVDAVSHGDAAELMELFGQCALAGMIRDAADTLRAARTGEAR